MSSEPSTPSSIHPAAVVHRDADPGESARANRRWWDAEARAYSPRVGFVDGDNRMLTEGTDPADVPEGSGL